MKIIAVDCDITINGSFSDDAEPVVSDAPVTDTEAGVTDTEAAVVE